MILNIFVFVDSVVFILFSELIIKIFRSSANHINTAHTHTPCLMMGEVSLENVAENIMIQYMINSENRVNDDGK